MYRVLLIGIMQGSRNTGIHDQGYRQRIRASLSQALADVELIDPDELHPGRLSYSEEQARSMFMSYVEEARKVNLVVAYLPEASMGSAVEMWEAYKAGVPVLTISPLCENWVIRLCSSRIFADLSDFEVFLAGAALDSLH